MGVTNWSFHNSVCNPTCASGTTSDMRLHFLADPDSPFRKSMVFNILTRVGDTASIPCLATDPSLDSLRLETCSSSALASGLQYSASLEQGIIIHNTQKAYEGCYVCTGKLREKHIRSRDYYLTVKPGKVVRMHGCVVVLVSKVPWHTCKFKSFFFSPRCSTCHWDAGPQKSDSHSEWESLPHLQHHQCQWRHKGPVGEATWLGETLLPFLRSVLCCWGKILLDSCWWSYFCVLSCMKILWIEYCILPCKIC